MKRWCISTVVLAALGLAGCQPNPFDDAAWPEGRRSGEHMAPYRLPMQSGEPREGDPTFELFEAKGELTLREAMALAVARNPKLRAFGWDVRRAEALALQAGQWPNPELEAEFENFAGAGTFSGIDSLETTVSLAQTFPLGGDIDHRRELADAHTRLANWDYEAARLAVLLEVTQRFIEALAADRRIDLAERELAWAHVMQELTNRRVEAGDASPVETTRVLVPVITAEVELARARRDREAAYRRVATMWDGRTLTLDRVVGEMEGLDPLPPVDALVQLINENPVVARWAAEISRRFAEQYLAEAEAAPDLTGRVGIKHHNEADDTALVVGISLPLPVFDRREGDILAARLGATAARQRQRETELRLEDMLSAAYAEMAGSHDEASALKARAIPAASTAHDATRRAFDEGKLPFLDVLDAQRTLFELQERYVDALARYHMAAAEIESLIGRRLTDLIQPVGPSDQEAQP